jgi:pimeloyl-ACP methyl ester carboxylesterase
MDERQPNQFPVAEIAGHRLDLGAAGVLPLCLNADWDRPLPPLTGALVMLHGRLRDAPVYYRTAMAAVGSRAGWLVVVPQFLAAVDIAAHGLAERTLRWSLTGWMAGDRAEGPADTGAFAVLDAVMAQIARRLPGLRRLVVAGHSGGAQMVQRYALLGEDKPPARYVVANPSSYAFLDAARPGPTAGCPAFDRWRYGLDGLPAYAGAWTRDALAGRYAGRDVRYLLGAEDTDPAHPALDVSCAAEAQGPHRRARGEAFYASLKARFPASPHRLSIVPGVGHSGSEIFASAEGAAALFD